jgi:hypothetical protein
MCLFGLFEAVAICWPLSKQILQPSIQALKRSSNGSIVGAEFGKTSWILCCYNGQLLMQKVKILVTESCVEVVKIEFLMQKVEISVRESCVEMHKFARLTPTQKGLRPP